ncbi:MAG: hypothetical protein GY928_00350 [Colwellia sp.]|nr:hypothetical protein [Colwellia sp.]
MGLDYLSNLYLEISTELEFGKHQGVDVLEVIENDPDYIRWLISEGVTCSDEIEAML